MLIQAQLETNISREDNNEKITIFRLIEDFYSKILGFFFLGVCVNYEKGKDKIISYFLCETPYISSIKFRSATNRSRSYVHFNSIGQMF